MELTDDLFMILMHSRNVKVGNTIYYVTPQDGSYVIRKSRIVKRTIDRYEGFRSFFDTYYYHREDGYRFNTVSLFLPIFETRSEAVEYVVRQLQCDINGAEVALRNAQERLGQLQRSLKVYQKHV